METINWRRCPSVWTGGKATFLTAQTSQGRFWISWNRMELMYEVVKDARRRPEALALVKTEAQGKLIVSEYLARTEANNDKEAQRT